MIVFFLGFWRNDANCIYHDRYQEFCVLWCRPNLSISRSANGSFNGHIIGSLTFEMQSSPVFLLAEQTVRVQMVYISSNKFKTEVALAYILLNFCIIVSFMVDCHSSLKCFKLVLVLSSQFGARYKVCIRTTQLIYIHNKFSSSN